MPPETLVSLPVDWPAPDRVRAFMATRAGGVSRGAFASLNLGDHVGDDAQAVAENRRRFGVAIGAVPAWLSQVHGTRVVELTERAHDAAPAADGAWTTRAGIACTVLVADCLPVLLAACNGRAVGAAHAGWRGLAGGVVERALEAVMRAAQCGAREVVAWLGPCIGPRHFEVGADVLEACAGHEPLRFTPSGVREGRPRWLADLPGLARDRLHGAGVRSVHGGEWCTVSDARRFYSYRRDGVTGRMAASVWLLP